MLGPSTVGCVAVVAWTVVISPSVRPNLSFITLARGARQLVVQLALDTTVSLAGSKSLAFTPMSRVGTLAESLVGALMTTRLAPAARCLLAPSKSVNRPVDSTTYSAPTLPQGSSAGLRTAVVGISFPLTRMPFSFGSTVPSNLPCVLSYFSRYARFSGGNKSLMPTNSMFGLLIPARKTSRPMRPNPLMPTFKAMMFLLQIARPGRQFARESDRRTI